MVLKVLGLGVLGFGLFRVYGPWGSECFGFGFFRGSVLLRFKGFRVWAVLGICFEGLGFLGFSVLGFRVFRVRSFYV